MNEKQFDVVVLGAGNAGMAVASAASAAKKTVAIIEPREFGGTCPNRGCTPKKILVAAADALDTIQRAGTHGISVQHAGIDWQALINRKQEMISFIPDAMEKAARARAELFFGEGKFYDEKTIRVGETLLEAKKIVIATGSRPRTLPFAGAKSLASSDDVLNLQSLPETVVFIGGGVIALEFSHVLARAGANVVVLEALPQLLPRMDKDAVTVLQQASEDVGIRFETGVKVIDVVNCAQLSEVVYEQAGKRQQIVANLVVNGAGREPRIDGLNLEAGNIAYEGSGISVDASFRSTTNPRVYVAGDALAVTPQLSPVATQEGTSVAQTILHDCRPTPESNVIPQAVYSIPALASVGLTEAEAEQAVEHLGVYVSDMSGWFSSKTFGEKTAWAKVLIDEDADRIVGAHLVGHRGEELIHLFTLAMNHDICASALKSTTYAFPTFSSDLKNLW